MSVRVSDLIFPGWQSLDLGRGWSDTFIFPISATGGLPPADYAQVVKGMLSRLARLRRGISSLWVPVSSPPGEWFIHEVRRALSGTSVPVAVTVDGCLPEIGDFSYWPYMDRVPVQAPPQADWPESSLSQSELRCLRAAARLGSAATIEIASQAFLSLPTVRQALASLDERGLVGPVKLPLVIAGEKPAKPEEVGWQVGRSGLSAALRSWGVPPGEWFPSRKERSAVFKPSQKGSFNNAGRHRRTVRLWPAWLRKAWPQADVWAGWSELSLHHSAPDSLAWGRLDGGDKEHRYETLFWLEVESGHLGGDELRRRMVERINRGLVYARRFPVRLVFVMLSLPWVVRTVAGAFVNLPEDVAVVLGNWRSFGSLPEPEWGRVAADDSINRSSNALANLWGGSSSSGGG